MVPPTAARALLKNVAMFCSLAVGGKPPTYIRRACRVACCEGGWTEPVQKEMGNQDWPKAQQESVQDGPEANTVACCDGVQPAIRGVNAHSMHSTCT